LSFPAIRTLGLRTAYRSCTQGNPSHVSTQFSLSSASPVSARTTGARTSRTARPSLCASDRSFAAGHSLTIATTRPLRTLAEPRPHPPAVGEHLPWPCRQPGHADGPVGVMPGGDGGPNTTKSTIGNGDTGSNQPGGDRGAGSTTTVDDGIVA
jgi:hypothetical protein